MLRRVSSAAMSLMILTIMITNVPNAESVKALGPICIRNDGHVDPPDAPIRNDDNITYTLTDDIFQTIIIEKNNIVLDGAGHAIQRGSQYLTSGITLISIEGVTVKNTIINARCQDGIYLHLSSGNTLSNNTLTTNVHGIMLDSSDNNTLQNNNATANGRHGIYLNSSNYNNVSGNSVKDNSLDGVHLDYSAYNNLLANNAMNNGVGICLYYSSSNNVTGNDANGNGFCGIDLQYSSNNTLMENNAAGNMDSGIYLCSSSNNIVSDNNTITGIGRYNQLDGVKLECSDSNRISDNKITANSHNGVSLCAKNKAQRGSLNNTVTANEIAENCGDGVFLDTSSGNNTVSNNTIRENLRHGVWIQSPFNLIDGNNIAENNNSGVWLTSCSCNTIRRNNISANSLYGAYLSYSESNLICGNNITDNINYGIWIVYQSDDNTICGNNVLNNSRGIDLMSSSNNRVYHNNFAGKLPLATGFTSTSTLWDEGCPNGGNCWSDYDGKDDDRDGLGDEPYEIDNINTDNHPLISAHYVTTSITCQRTAVAQGCCINTSITILNCGAYTENVNLTFFANSTLIDQEVIPLFPSGAENKTFTWKAPDEWALYKNISLTACASPVSEETNLIAHNCTGGCVIVTLIGDITGPPNDYPDGVRDLKDVGAIAKAFGALQNATDGWYWHQNLCKLCPGGRPHNPNYDTNNDGRIDMKDVGLVAKNALKPTQ